MAKVFDLSNSKDVDDLLSFLDMLMGLSESKDFQKFIADKCKEELEGLMERRLAGITEKNLMPEQILAYKGNNKYILDGEDFLTIRNDTTLEQEDMYWVSEKTKMRYPNGISVAKIIEYGIGMLGTDDDDDNWFVNFPSPSKHADGSWTYKRDETLYINVYGMEGRFIYQGLRDAVTDHFTEWLREFLAKEVKK